MQKIRRILFAADLSPQCRAVAPYVRAMANSFHSELVVLNALEAPSGYYKDWNAYLTLVNWEAIREDRQRRLSAFVRKAFEAPPVMHLMEEGDPAHTIVNYAREHDMDLIMMPTHGYGPFRGLLIGSVTAKVLHDVEVPVWTSAHVPELDPNVPTTYRRILCAVDITEKSIPVMRWAAEFARHFKSTLDLVHAVGGAEAVDPSFQSFLFSTARNSLAKLQQSAGVDAATCVSGGAVGQVVREAALQHHADLVVIGRGHLCETLGRLRTNAYAVIRQSPCPVISV
jgi:nucleotide-binding universal stress UspA family protein